MCVPIDITLLTKVSLEKMIKMRQKEKEGSAQNKRKENPWTDLTAHPLNQYELQDYPNVNQTKHQSFFFYYS